MSATSAPDTVDRGARSRARGLSLTSHLSASASASAFGRCSRSWFGRTVMSHNFACTAGGDVRLRLNRACAVRHSGSSRRNSAPNAAAQAVRRVPPPRGSSIAISTATGGPGHELHDSRFGSGNGGSLAAVLMTGAARRRLHRSMVHGSRSGSSSRREATGPGPTRRGKSGRHGKEFDDDVVVFVSYFAIAHAARHFAMLCG
jgi:hypothetical protein